jgi:hypothetical protein
MKDCVEKIIINVDIIPFGMKNYATSITVFMQIPPYFRRNKTASL